jgi:hypothetical protein
MATMNTRKVAKSPDQMESLGGLKFPAQEYDLAGIPDNDRAGRDAASMMPYIRLSAVFLRESDGDLEEKVRATFDPEGMDAWMDLLEGIGDALDAKRQDAEILEAGFTRLLVAIERVLGEPEIKRAYSKPKNVPRGHLAAIRARLHRRAPFRPRLVTGGQS